MKLGYTLATLGLLLTFGACQSPTRPEDLASPDSADPQDPNPDTAESSPDQFADEERTLTAIDLPLDRLSLPPGFAVDVFAVVPNARSLAANEEGTVFVGSREADHVYAVQDRDADGKADAIRPIGQNLDTPNGVAWRDGDLYVAEINRILRYDDIDGRLDDPPEPVVIRDDYPTDRSHGWKYIAFGPDGKLYVPVGAPCNICNPGDEIYAAITRIDPDGGNREIITRGVRNTVGFDWHPDTGALWFTDNGRDRLGDDLPGDELNRLAEPGQHFGYPFCHAGDVADPEFGGRRPCAEFTAPAQKLGPHVAALGMKFYTADMFPSDYRGDVFIAEHGSWNRSQKIGYRVMRVPVADGNAAGYEPFIEGWLQGEQAWGRPVDLLIRDDGSMLLSDDLAGVVYRITYAP